MHGAVTNTGASYSLVFQHVVTGHHTPVNAQQNGKTRLANTLWPRALKLLHSQFPCTDFVLIVHVQDKALC